MRQRFRDWTENLQFDWCISRQRYFGVPFPVWYAVGPPATPTSPRDSCGRETLPVDPMVDAPPGYPRGAA